MIKNTAASVHARLTNLARDTRRPFQEVLQHYGLERFLYRLAQSSHRTRFVLKGALLLRAWGAPMSRPTRDIDFLGYVANELGVVEAFVREVCTGAVIDDGLTFDGASIASRRIKEDAEYQGIRITFTGFLARSRIPMQLDIGFGDVVHPRRRGEHPEAVGRLRGALSTRASTQQLRGDLRAAPRFPATRCPRARRKASVRRALVRRLHVGHGDRFAIVRA